MFKPKIAITVVFLTLIYSSIASARQWVVLGNNPQISVDIDSIKGTGSTRNFWQEVVYDEDKYQNGQRYRSVRALTIVNCESREIGLSRSIFYSADGDVVKDNDLRRVPSEELLDSVIPDSIGEAVLTYICERRTSNEGVDSTYSTASRSVTLSKQEAINTINRWLQAKAEIFAPPFNQRLVDELTTGKLRNELISSDGPVSWLKKNNAYYQYGTQRIESTRMFATSTNKAVLELRITEEAILHKNGVIESQEPNLKTHNVRFYLEQINGKWKISDRQILN